MQAVGCHVYTGGFSAGVVDHFDVVAHLETSSPARKYQRSAYSLLRSRFPAPVHVGAEGWPPVKADLLYGNPPCSLWSRLGVKKDPAERLRCLGEFLVVAMSADVKVVAFESLQSFDRTAVFDLLLTKYAELHLLRHDCKFLGLPQSRPRLFVVASNVRLDFDRPLGVKVTVAEALAKVPEPGYYEPTPDEWLAPWAMGGRISKNFRTVYGTAVEGLRRPSFARRRLEPHRVSYCLTKAIYMYHPHEPRVLGTNEVSAFMGYPPSWDWPKDARTWMCRGVTPAAARYLSSNVARCLDLDRPPTPGLHHWDYSAPTDRRDDWRMGPGELT